MKKKFEEFKELVKAEFAKNASMTVDIISQNKSSKSKHEPKIRRVKGARES